MTALDAIAALIAGSWPLWLPFAVVGSWLIAARFKGATP